MRKCLLVVLVLGLSACSASTDPKVFIAQGDRTYHAANCPLLGNNGKAYRRSVVVAQGYSPCSTCQYDIPPTAPADIVVTSSLPDARPGIREIEEPLVLRGEFEERMEIAKSIYTRCTVNQIEAAATYIYQQGSPYYPGLDRLRAIEMLIDASPENTTTVYRDRAMAVHGVNSAGQTATVVGVSQETARLRADVGGVHEVAEAIVRGLYENYMAPIWAQQEAEKMRVQANRARDLEAVEDSRREREARHNAIAEESRRTTEFLQQKGAADQAQRVYEHKRRTGY